MVNIEKIKEDSYQAGFNAGVSKGRYEVLSTILKIRNEAKYPEYLEEDIDEYLRMEDLL